MIFFFSTFIFLQKVFYDDEPSLTLYIFMSKNPIHFIALTFFFVKNLSEKKTIFHLEGATTHITYLMLYPHSEVTEQFWASSCLFF